MVAFSLISLSFYAQDLDPLININVEGNPLSVVFSQIEDQSNYKFSYNSKKINGEQLIDFKVNNKTLQETLRQLGEKAHFTYDIMDDQIILTYLQKPKKKRLIYGYIEDAESGESLIGALVYCKEGRQNTISNEFGYYAFNLEEGVTQIYCSYLGYDLKPLSIPLKSRVKQNIKLDPVDIDLPEVIVDKKEDQLSTENGANLDGNAFTGQAEFGGEVGLIRGLQTITGIHSHGDGSSFYYVRGGLKDQNLIYLDDAPLYNCLLYTSPSPRDATLSRMPSSA